MKGDVIEICLAALTEHYLFKDALQLQLEADGLTYPVVFQYLCDLCVLVQYIDACLCRGSLKCTANPVAKLTVKPLFKTDPLVLLWIAPRKCFCLAALL